MGTGMQIPFPIYGIYANANGSGKFYSRLSWTGMEVENSIPDFRERECEAGIPKNGREREFPLTSVWIAPFKEL